MNELPGRGPVRVAGLAAAVLLAPVLVLLPTLAGPRHAAHPVAPQAHDLVLTGVDRSALPDLASAPAPEIAPVPGRAAPHTSAPPPARTVVLARATSTARFSVLGLTWARADAGLPLDVQVRTHAAGGSWSSWEDVGGVDDAGADADTAEGRVRPGTSAVWAGVADGVEVRVAGARAPHDLRLSLIDPGRSAADVDARPLTPSPGSASADTGRPAIVTRAQWGADESLVTHAPDYADPVSVAFVHHTDSTNAYTAAQSAAMVRGIFAYHVRSRGWNDIGYNVLVDRFGTVFEGRGGGLDRGVVGAHTGGFNTHSFGVALLGSFDRVAPPRAMLRGVTRLLAWKLGLGYLDPTARTTLVNHGFSGARYPTGATVPFAVVSAHRDADITACPGARGFAALPGLRRAVQAAMGPSLVAPSVTPASRGLLDPGGFVVAAGAVNPLSWRLTVTDDATGVVVRTLTPSAPSTGGVSASWDRLDDRGLPVPAGTYDLRLEPFDGTASGRPWSAQVSVVSPLSLEVPSTAPYGQLVLGGRAPAGAAVTVESRTPASDTVPAGDWQPLASATGDPTGRWAASAPVADDVELRAHIDGVTTAPRVVRLVPTVTQAGAATYGHPLPLAGTARPGDAVALHATTAGRVVDLVATADSTGAWTAALDGVADWRVTPSARGTAGAPLTAALTPTTDPAPEAALTLGSPLAASGTSAPGGEVTLELRRPGADWTAAARTVAGPDGRWSAAAPLPDDVELRATHAGLASTVTRTAHVVPTAGGPVEAGYGTLASVSGTSRPGAPVTVQLAPAGASDPTPSPATLTTTAGRNGHWSVGWRLTGPTSWTADAGGRPAGSGSTAVAPTLAPAGVAVAGLPLTVSGTGQPGVPVALRLGPGGGPDVSVLPREDGRLAVTLTPLTAGPVAVTAEAAGRSARQELTVQAATVDPSAAAPLGSVVAVGGLARPGSAVTVETQRRSGGGWTTAASVVAGADGRWTASIRLDDELALRATTTDGSSKVVVGGVQPTVRAPASARRRALVALAGTARPGALVTLLAHASGRPWHRAGFARADRRGRWGLRLRLTRWTAYVAVADGRRSPAVAVRAV